MLRARDMMDRAYAEPLDIPALARIAHVSEAHFIRTFRDTFGETPHQYLRRRRVERAMFLLQETNRSITDICLEVGFNSLGTFSRTFRQIVGEQVADVLNRVRQPFNVNSLALAAAVAALADEAYLTESRQLNLDGMRQLERGFSELGLQWIPSRGNFIAVDLGRDAGPVYQGLLRAGVIVRPVAGYEMPNHLRVSIGLQAENQRFLEALAGVLGQ